VRQVAYGTLARRDRKQTHLDVLESFTREGSVEVPAVSAQHCISAIEAVPDAPDVPELTARAVGLLRQAADRARSLGSPSEAAGHLGRTLELVMDPELASELRLEKAEACLNSDRYAEAIVLSRDVQKAAIESGDRDQQAIATAVLAEALTRGPEDLDAAMQEIQPWYDQLKDDPETTVTFLRVLNAYVLVLTRRGETDLDVSMRFLRAAEWLGDHTTMARALNGLSIVLSRQGRSVTMSTMLLEKAAEVAHDAHDLIGEGIALCNLASVTCGSDVARATALGVRAREVTLRAGSPGWSSFAISNLARAHWLAGLWDDVEAAWGSELIEADDEQYVAFHVGRVLAARQQDPEPVVSATTERQLSAAYRTLGLAVTATYREDRAAVGLARSGLELVLEENGVHDEYTEVHGFVLEVALKFGDRELLDHLRQVVLEAGALLPAGLRGHDAYRIAIDASPAMLPEEVERLFNLAVQEYETWGSTVYVARARAAYGVWLSRQGRAEDALAQLADARRTYEELGAVGWLRELDEQLAAPKASQTV
jgi:hypothetical protein